VERNMMVKEKVLKKINHSNAAALEYSCISPVY